MKYFELFLKKNFFEKLKEKLGKIYFYKKCMSIKKSKYDFFKKIVFFV